MVNQNITHFNRCFFGAAVLSALSLGQAQRIPVRAQFRLLWCLLIAWLVSACLPQVADAALITITITGTVSSGTDESGIFLPPGSDLTGQNFTLIFTFNDTLGTETVEENCPTNAPVPCGSENSGTDSGTAVLTIGSGTYSFDSPQLTSVSRNTPSCGNSYCVGISDSYPYPNPDIGYDTVGIGVSPAPGTPPFGGTYDWRSAFADSQIVGYGNPAGYVGIQRASSAFANLSPTGITVSGGGSGTPPSIVTGGVLNAASYAKTSSGVGSPVAPGSLVAIFTSALSAQAASFTTSSLPSTLGGASVTFNGVTAPLVQVAPTGTYPFVSVQVPFEVLAAGQTSATVPVVITVNGVPSAAVPTQIVASQPGIFTLNAEGTGQAVLVNLADYSIAAPSGTTANSHPIAPGQAAFFYVTGLGAMTPSVPDGSGVCPAANGLCDANAMPTVLVGGISAPVAFAGQAPGYPGVSQVNITVPQNAPTGSTVSLVVKSADGTVTSNTATIAVQ